MVDQWVTYNANGRHDFFKETIPLSAMLHTPEATISGILKEQW